jgi:thymidylate synthase (FAD)
MNNKVELIGTYGGDQSHALSAWTSTSRDLTEAKRERIGGLLKMLAESGHHTPFEKSTLHFLVTCDTASHIHLIKHRIGVSINGESARYKELQEDKFLVPKDWPADVTEFYKRRVELSYEYYHDTIEKLVESGVDRKRAKESARFLLPYANQTVADVSFNFRSFMHFQGLRNKPEAQLEIREIAQKMLELVRDTGEFDLSLDGFGYNSSTNSGK